MKEQEREVSTAQVIGNICALIGASLLASALALIAAKTLSWLGAPQFVCGFVGGVVWAYVFLAIIIQIVQYNSNDEGI